jgi:hypothetical protein
MMAEPEPEAVDALRDRLEGLDVDALSPREALDILYELKRLGKEESKMRGVTPRAPRTSSDDRAGMPHRGAQTIHLHSIGRRRQTSCRDKLLYRFESLRRGKLGARLHSRRNVDIHGSARV